MVTTISSGQEKHRIDIEYETCHSVDSNWTTYGMMRCEENARDEWDTELNQFYQMIFNHLSDKQRENLKLAQKKWIEFRDLELTYSTGLYQDMQGTMWGIASVSRQRELNRTRALELIAYYENLTAGLDKEEK